MLSDLERGLMRGWRALLTSSLARARLIRRVIFRGVKRIKVPANDQFRGLENQIAHRYSKALDKIAKLVKNENL